MPPLDFLLVQYCTMYLHDDLVARPDARRRQRRVHGRRPVAEGDGVLDAELLGEGRLQLVLFPFPDLCLASNSTNM